MPVKPPKTTARASKDRMMGAGGAAPSPTKPNQAGASAAKCGACGHYHKPGSICSNKSFDGVLSLLKADENRVPAGSNSKVTRGGKTVGAGGTYTYGGSGVKDKKPIKNSGPHGSGDGDGKKTKNDSGVVSTTDGFMSEEDFNAANDAAKRAEEGTAVIVGKQTSEKQKELKEVRKEEAKPKEHKDIAENLESFNRVREGAKNTPRDEGFGDNTPNNLNRIERLPPDALDTFLGNGPYSGVKKPQKAQAPTDGIPSAPDATGTFVGNGPGVKPGPTEGIPSAPEPQAPTDGIPSAPEPQAPTEGIPSAPEPQAPTDELSSLMDSAASPTDGIPSAPEPKAPTDELSSLMDSAASPTDGIPSAPDATDATDATVSPDAPDAPEETILDKLKKDSKYDRTYDMAIKQGYSKEDAHSAASLATDGHTKDEGWMSPNERRAAAKEQKDIDKEKKDKERAAAKEQNDKEMAAAKDQKSKERAIAKEQKDKEMAAAKDQKSKERAIAKEKRANEMAAAKEQKSKERAIAKEQKARSKEFEPNPKAEAAFQRQASRRQDQQAMADHSRSARMDKLGKQDFAQDLAFANDLPTGQVTDAGGGIGAVPQSTPKSGVEGLFDFSDTNTTTGPEMEAPGSPMETTQTSNGALENDSSSQGIEGLIGPSGVPSTRTRSQDKAGFRDARNALANNVVRPNSKAEIENDRSGNNPASFGPGGGTPGGGTPVGGASQGKTQRQSSGVPFSQMYGAGAGIGSSMTQDAGAAGATSAFAAQRAHQLLNPDLRNTTAPAMAGTGTGARTKDKHSVGTQSALAPGMGNQ